MKMICIFVLLSFITSEIKFVFPELLLNPYRKQRIRVRYISGIALQKVFFCLHETCFFSNGDRYMESYLPSSKVKFSSEFWSLSFILESTYIN